MAVPAHGVYSNGGYNGSGGSGGGYGGGPFSDRNDSPSRQGPGNPYYNPYDAHSISRNNLNGLDYVDPAALADDGDDGLGPANPKRRSMISLGRHSMRSNTQVNALGVAGAAGAAGGIAAAGMSRGVNEHYGANGSNGSRDHVPAEKTVDPFIPFQPEEKKNGWKKWLFMAIGILILGGIAGGVAGGLIQAKKSENGGNGSGAPGTSSQDTSGDYSKDSPRVKDLLNNKNLHKVFMGMAYTPLNMQYPDCLNFKPIQNNVTMDMAIIGQLTNTVRLYGTDCNQTEMVLHAIDRLGLTDMKVWVGVWLGNNDTTNTRQMAQMYNILDTYGTKHIKGVVVGNEVLFRKDLTITQLGTILQGVKTNMSAKYNSLPVASSDLGDNWTTDLASQVDVVMSNVHPFFGGVTVDQAAAWTWSFWQSHDVYLTQGLTGKTHVISEIGWPSQGGNDCGAAGKCPDKTSGSVSGITQMNTFMASWVCQAMNNGTEYFW
jgi:exo-beta-1,3-glucanase (GH17 family)